MRFEQALELAGGVIVCADEVDRVVGDGAVLHGTRAIPVSCHLTKGAALHDDGIERLARIGRVGYALGDVL